MRFLDLLVLAALTWLALCLLLAAVLLALAAAFRSVELARLRRRPIVLDMTQLSRDPELRKNARTLERELLQRTRRRR